MRSNGYKCLAASSLIVIAASGGAYGDVSKSERTLLERTMRDYQSAVETIRTLHCRVKEEATTPQGQTRTEIEFDKDLNELAATVRVGDTRVKSLFKNGRNITATIAGPSLKTSQITGEIDPTGSPEQFPAWRMILPPAVYVKANEQLAFAEAIGREPAIVQHVKELDDGVEVDLDDAYGRRAVLFSKKYNYMISKVTFTSKDAGTVAVSEYKMREYLPGVHFIEQGTTRMAVKGKQISETIYQISNVKINERVPRDVFSVKFHPGSGVRDRTQDKVLKVLADGSLGSEHPDIHLSTGQPLEARDPIEVTTDEPPSSYRWVIAAASAILFSAGVLWIIRRRHSREKQNSESASGVK